MSEPLTIIRRDHAEAVPPRSPVGSGRPAPREGEGDPIDILISGLWSSYRRARTLPWDWRMNGEAEGVSLVAAAQHRIARIFAGPMQGAVPDHTRRRAWIGPD